MTAVGEGNYSGACGMLTPHARRALVSAVARRRSCQAVFKRCIPINPQALKRDQSQLLYAGVLPVIHGPHAQVSVSGTEVARELKRLTLLRARGTWLITGPGRALSRCRAKLRRHHRPGRL